jgi:outer membrane immunogenic protein
MKKLAIFIPAALLIGTPALAADLGKPVYKAPPPPPAPVCIWCGFYVGVNAGGHWAHVSDPAFFAENNGYFGFPDNVAAANSWPNTLNLSGFAGGGQVGYNWQIPNSSFVLGFEADIDGLTGSSSRAATFPENGGFDHAFVGDSARDRWISTVRARAGWAFNQTLFYVTGGAAFSHWEMGHSFADTAGPTTVSVTNTSTRSGWTVGGGLEYAFLNNWTVRGEYLYANFGTFNNSLSGTCNFGGCPQAVFVVLHPEKLTENIVRVGVNYKFGWGAPVVANY